MTAAPMIGFGPIDYVALAAYLAGMLALGWWCGRRVTSSRSFFIADGNMNPVLVGLSIMGTYLSALTMMALPAAAFGKYNLLWTVQLPFLILTGFIVVKLVLPKYRDAGVISIYEYLEQRLNTACRLLASGTFVLFSIARNGVVLVLPAMALSVATGVEVEPLIILLGVVMTVYTVMGGIEAVVWTDAVQVVVLVGAAIISGFYMMTSISMVSGHTVASWVLLLQILAILAVGWHLARHLASRFEDWLVTAGAKSQTSGPAQWWQRVPLAGRRVAANFLLPILAGCLVSLLVRLSSGWTTLILVAVLLGNEFWAVRQRGQRHDRCLLYGLAAAAVAGLWMMFQVGAGADFLRTAAEHGKLQMWQRAENLRDVASLWLILETIFQTVRIYATQQDMAQRYLTTGSTKDAERSIWIGILGYIPVAYLFYLIGTALFVFYQFAPDAQAAAALEQNPNSIYPFFVVHHLPAGLSAVVIAAIFAAAMSSIDSLMNSASTVCVEDFYKRLRPPISWAEARQAVAAGDPATTRVFVVTDDEDAHYLAVARGLTVVWGALATVTALALSNMQQALETFSWVQGVFTTGVLGLLVLALLPIRVRGAAAVTGYVASYLLLFWLMNWPPFLLGGTPRVCWLLYPVLTNTFCVVVALLVNAALARLEQPKPTNEELPEVSPDTNGI